MRKAKNFGRILRWTAHILFLLLALVGLWAVNYFFQLDKALRTPLPTLRMVWLPLLCGLVYGLIWLGWWISRVLAASKEPSPFPDIDSAWRTAVRELEQRGVDLVHTPLFLSLGRPADREINLFNAARLSLAAPPAPRDAEAPLRVYATHEAIYVTCGELSLLGQQAKRFAAARREAEERAAATGPTMSLDAVNRELESGDVDVQGISSPEGEGDANDASHPKLTSTSTKTQPSTATAPRTAMVAQGLSLVEERVAMLVAEEEPADDSFVEYELAQLDPLTVDLAEALLKDAGEVELITARLRRLCKLIAEERHPHNPLHGAMVLIPAAAADDDRAANHVAVLAQKDLDTVRDAAQVDCPHVAIVCDLEQTPGCTELLARFPDDQRQRRLGVRFPRLSIGDAPKAAGMIDEGLTWLCNELVPPLVYRLLPLSRTDTPSTREPAGGNTALYRFLYRMRNRRRRLTRILQRAMCADRLRPTLLGGCFLVATGGDSQREQGFAAAVFSQLNDMKDLGNWTASAVEQDRKQRRLAKFGYAAIVALVAVLLLAVWKL
jgi:hypothetical protein